MKDKKKSTNKAGLAVGAGIGATIGIATGLGAEAILPDDVGTEDTTPMEEPMMEEDGDAEPVSTDSYIETESTDENQELVVSQVDNESNHEQLLEYSELDVQSGDDVDNNSTDIELEVTDNIDIDYITETSEMNFAVGDNVDNLAESSNLEIETGDVDNAEYLAEPSELEFVELSPEEPEIEVSEYVSIDDSINGMVDIATVEVDGVEVYVVDNGGDRIADYIASDLNNNDILEEDEIIDISEEYIEMEPLEEIAIENYATDISYDADGDYVDEMYDDDPDDYLSDGFVDDASLDDYVNDANVDNYLI